MSGTGERTSECEQKSLQSAGVRPGMVSDNNGTVVWITGLSGAGKSTIAQALTKDLSSRGHRSYILDGDNVRRGLNSDLGFSPEDRDENIRRIGEVAALFADAGIIGIVAFISPYRLGRRSARRLAPEGRFIEVFLDTPLEVCEERDPKGLYRKARAGEIPDFTGIDAPYERPESAEIVLDTSRLNLGECVARIAGHLREHLGYA